ncbi:MAG TPA: LysR family transcriptional regulator [Burkholderiaceae bacterium]
MEMRHLRCLVAVAEELHFGRAARRLNLSQPPVSLAIKELEAELGVTLFERNSRRIALTRQGEEALHDARAVLARAELLRRRAHESAQGRTGTLTLGFISLAPYSFLPGALRRFMADYPKVKVTLQESTTDRILAELEIGGLDLGFIFASPGMSATLAYRPLQREPLIVALPATHPLAKSARVPLERLAHERFLHFERHYGPMVFDAMVATCMRHGFSPDLFPARQMHTIVSLVAGGIGVALVPASVKAMPREGVAYRPIQGEHTLVETGAAWRGDGDDGSLAQAFLGTLPQPGR